MNLNLMHINENYSSNSHYEDSQQHQNSIKVENDYELQSDRHSAQSGDYQHQQQTFHIDHSLDDLSLEHDTFLQNLQLQQLTNKSAHTHIKTQENRSLFNYLMVDKTNIQANLIQTQSTDQTISFSNISNSHMKIRLNQCPFQVNSHKSLAFVQAKQVQISLQPYQKLEVTFLIKPLSQSYGDIIQTVVVTGELVGKSELVSPISINFNVKYSIPRLRFKYQGKSDYEILDKTRIPIVKLKANKIGEYSINFSLDDDCPKMNVNIETRGRITPSLSKITISPLDYSCLKLRRKANHHNDERQKHLLILKLADCKLSYLIGIDFLS